jgi:hypothetical protein
LSLIYSDYYYGLNIDFVGFQWDSGIKNNIKYDFKTTFLTVLNLLWINGIYYEFNPGTIRPSNPTSGINFDQLDKKYALNLRYTLVQSKMYPINLV